jgi:hypothetical protein
VEDGEMTEEVICKGQREVERERRNGWRLFSMGKGEKF